MGSIHFLVLLSLISISLADVPDVNTLKFVHVLWRHGDRTPAYRNFPTDIKNGVKTWYNKGFGELTPVGMRQHSQLGKWLASRYVATGFLNKTSFDQRQMYIRSTNYNRTLMSALSNLAGMYPPMGKQLWNSNIKWQPIPVHTVTKNDDPLLRMSCHCPNEVANSKHFMANDPDVIKINHDLLPFYQNLSNKTGWSIKNLGDIWQVMDPINCEYLHSTDKLNPARWPSWVTIPIYKRLLSVYNTNTKYDYPGLMGRRLRGGPLLGEIMQRMDYVRKADPKLIDLHLKYYVYSAHDTTVIALLKNLGVYDQNPQLPPYASAVIIELHNITGQWIVKTIYQNETTETGMGNLSGHPMQVDGCNNYNCSLDQFIKRGQNYVPQDWYRSCGRVAPVTFSQWKTPFIIAVIACGFLGIALATVSLLFIRRVSKNPNSNPS